MKKVLLSLVAFAIFMSTLSLALASVPPWQPPVYKQRVEIPPAPKALPNFRI
jgi:hypothetical protein